MDARLYTSSNNYYYSFTLGYKYYRTYINIGVPVSVKSAENIKKLQSPASHVTSEVTMTSDSILGVGMNIYELR